MFNDYDEKYIPILEQRLSPYRLNHSKEVAKSAYNLALKYGSEPEKAYLSGLLHDILKEADKNEIFDLALKYGVTLTTLEKNAKKLWHSILGAEYIKNELGITDSDILNAVRYHTTGRASMSLLEKILFTADFVSADREYDGVNQMRKKAEISLDEAMNEGLSFTIAELVKNGFPIHPDTVHAYNELKERKY